MNRNRLDTCIDWVLCAVFVICLLMMGFCIGRGDHLMAASFAMNLASVSFLMITRKEMKDESEEI